MNLMVQPLIMLFVGVTAWFTWRANRLRVINVTSYGNRPQYLFSEGVLLVRWVSGTRCAYLIPGGADVTRDLPHRASRLGHR